MGKRNLRKAGISYPYAQWQYDEILKCIEPKVGIHYFFKNYLKTLSLNEGQLVPFLPRPYQVTMIDNMINNRFNIFKNPRQSGKTTTTAGVYTYLMNFFPYEVCGIVANKDRMAIEIVSVMEEMFINLPFWMQQGVVTWQGGGFELENGSRVISQATSRDALRGFPIKNLFWDEVAAVRTNLASDFLASIYPTIASASSSRLTLSSTPDGYNHFAKFWYDAINKINQFIPFEVAWNEIPGRDEAFKKATISNIGETRWNAEFECIFLGSTDTLISGKKLQQLFHRNPIKTYHEDKMKIYKEPVITKKDMISGKITPGHYYVVCGDVSEGKKQDYYTVSVIDVSVSPFEQVAVYRDNEMPYQLYTSIVDDFIRMYGNSNVLVIIETNHGFGKEVLDVLSSDIGTEAMIYMDPKKKVNGIRMTTKTKRLGCANLKTLIEYEKLLVVDFDTINELYKFSRKGKSYEAEEGHFDDMVMSLVFFAYVQSTGFLDEFLESPISFREKFMKENIEKIESEIPAFGIISDGLEDTPERNRNIDDGDDERMMTSR
jgi:hypothetical protein